MKIKNLVFEGGGVKGIAYVGALQALENTNSLKDVQRVAGTSAGAITAMLLALGYSTEEVLKIMWEVDFRKFMDDDWGLIRDTYRLTQYYGWYKGEYFLDYAKKLVAEKTGNPNTTLKELHNLKETGNPKFKNLKDLYTIGVNLCTGMPEEFSFESKHANVPIALAVRISMSIPLFFKAVKLNDCIYVDGGVILNYPIQLFDKPKYCANVTEEEKKNNKLIVFNPETLGFRLDTKEEIDLFLKGEHPPSIKIDSLYAYAQALTTTILNLQNHFHLSSPMDIERTIYCDTLDVNGVDFKISDKKKKALILSGQKAVTRYFAKALIKEHPQTVEKPQNQNENFSSIIVPELAQMKPVTFPIGLLQQFSRQLKELPDFGVQSNLEPEFFKNPVPSATGLRTTVYF